MNASPLSLVLTIPGTPIPKARARRGKGGRHYTPSTTRTYEAGIRLLVQAARPPGWPLDANYGVELCVVFPDRRARDLDNVCKSVLDACNGVLWDDDRRVSRITIDRFEPSKQHPRVKLAAWVRA